MVDNMYDAVIMAGSMVIFIIALTVCISSFSTMRSKIDGIIEYDAKLDLLTDESGNYINYYTHDSDVRTVGVETVVSSMYRVPKENYVVYIAGLDTISTEIKETSLSQKYNDDTIIGSTDKVIKISINGENYDIDRILGEYGLYKKLKGKKFKEYLGVYQLGTDDSVDEINKTTYRVITYVVQ